MTIIHSCENKNCVNKFQDELYNGKRVMNKKKQGDGTSKTYSCTSCGREHNVGGDSKKKGR